MPRGRRQFSSLRSAGPSSTIGVDSDACSGTDQHRIPQESEHPVAGKVQLVGVPVKLSETPGSVREPAPLLGQHTDEVLRTYLGMGEAEITALRQARVIGTKR